MAIKPQSTHAPLVSVRALCKDFHRPNGNKFAVLEGISLEIHDGEFLALVGISGSGKTTLLRCIAGLLQPDRGTVTFSEPPKKTTQLLSFVFQNFALLPWLTVRENVELAMQATPRADRAAQVDRMLNLLGLGGFEDCRPRELSGGMKQRVSLCRAMVGNPMLLLMDEPFSALDALTGESMRSEMGRLWMQPDRAIRSAVLVTHSLSEALQLADRIIILSSNPGRIYKSFDVPLARPRNPHLKAYQDLEADVERAFGELHLDAWGTNDSQNVHDLTLPLPSLSASFVRKRVKPLINTGLTLMEGLLARLWEETEDQDLYDLCEAMGQSVDQMLPAVASAEMLDFITTPGTKLVLTSLGRSFASEQNPLARQELLREACLSLPLIEMVQKIVKEHGEDGLERSEVMAQIVNLLPFEDPDIQFEALVKWTRHVDLLSYDAAKDLLFAET